MVIERKEIKQGGEYSPTGLAIHHARYLVAKPFVEGKTVLDIACGEGLGASQMARFWGAKHVTSVDNSSEAIASANENNNQVKNLDFICDDAYKYLEKSNKKFDLIVCIETIEHVCDPKRLLELLSAKLADGGKVVITCPNDEFYYGPGTSLNHHHQSVFTFEQFKEMCEKYLGKATWMMGTKLAGFASMPMYLSEKKANFHDDELEPGFAGQLCEVVPVGGPGAHLLRPEGSVFFAGIFSDEMIKPSPTIGLIAASSSYAQNIPGKYPMVQGKIDGKPSAICFVGENEISTNILTKSLDNLPNNRFTFSTCNIENITPDELEKINTNRFSQIHFQSLKSFRKCLSILSAQNADLDQRKMMWKVLNTKAAQVWSLGLQQEDYGQLSTLEQSLLNLIIIKRGTKLDIAEHRQYCETEVDLFFLHDEVIKLENELEIMRFLILAQKRGAASLHSLRLQVLKSFTVKPRSASKTERKPLSLLAKVRGRFRGLYGRFRLHP